MPTCPECGTEQPPGRFCGHCGALLARRDDVPGPRQPQDHEPARGRPRRFGRWTAAVAALVIVVTAVVATVDRPNRVRTDDPATVGPTEPVSARAVAPRTPSTPPRPETETLACGATPGCVAWRTDCPNVEGISAPTAGGDARHAYLGAALPDGSGALYAVDPTNGIQLWRRPLPGVATRPAFAEIGAVIVAYEDPSGGTTIQLFDPDTGESRRTSGGVLHARTLVPPVAAGGVFAVAGPRRMVIERIDGAGTTIVELDATPTALLAAPDHDGATFLVQTDSGQVLAHGTDGSLLWSLTSTVLASGVADGRTALVDGPGHVVGVDVAHGEVWRTRLDVAEIPPVVTAEQVIVVTRSGSLVRLSLEDGTELGRYRWPVEVWIGPSATRDTVHIPICGRGVTGFVAVDARTGERRWLTTLNAEPGACVTAPPAAEDGANLLVSAGARLYGIRP